MLLLWERIYPYCITVLVGAGCMYIYSKNSFPTLEKEFFSTAVALFGVLLGFLSTTKALLIGMNSPVIEFLRESSRMDDLINYIAQAVWGCFIACLANIVAFFVSGSSWFDYYIIVLVLVCVFALTAFFRITRLMISILRKHYVKTSTSAQKVRPRATTTDGS
ncbi:hypothetical protein B9T12_04715 [Wohlfahrtiimonas chitiniclastica]|uniref:hypothetical protein n=1 Tax=Wohlfahrtiimonas chitiniclastica TaxID=400946 RepID=UPI000B98DB11|nr:hypothetical protein [Wohlfahrtiimonas chitiniclastica]OYQ79080.1 hypothetical protein B9T12_04715 [Wohlfahrtiimonas chitiniclastica]